MHRFEGLENKFLRRYPFQKTVRRITQLERAAESRLEIVPPVKTTSTLKGRSIVILRPPRKRLRPLPA
jgi:hypothetical protein